MILMTNGSLMTSLNEGRKYCKMLPLGAFCNTFDLHYTIISLENHFGLIKSRRFTQVVPAFQLRAATNI